MGQIIKIDCVIGVDPGAGGGLAVFIPGQKVKVAKMPKDITELRDFFEYYASNYNPVAFLEKLSVRPDDVSVSGDRAALGKLFRIQKMMANYEHLKAIIEAVGVPYLMVHPMSWQTKLKLRKYGEKVAKRDRKRCYQMRAGELYPEVKATLWNADALLIMHFGRWVLVNDPKWVMANLPEREKAKIF